MAIGVMTPVQPVETLLHSTLMKWVELKDFPEIGWAGNGEMETQISAPNIQTMIVANKRTPSSVG